jgi:hypothetical protein
MGVQLSPDGRQPADNLGVERDTVHWIKPNSTLLEELHHTLVTRASSQGLMIVAIGRNYSRPLELKQPGTPIGRYQALEFCVALVFEDREA